MIRMSAAEHRSLGLPSVTHAQADCAHSPAANNEDPVHRDVLRLRLGSRYLVQHTPNGLRSRVQGGREKRLGAVRGWPDLAVYARGPAGPAC